jgi:hypothetical protein
MDTYDHRLLVNRITIAERELAETRQMNQALMRQIDALVLDLEFYRTQAQSWLNQINHLSSAPTANSSAPLRAEITKFLTAARIEGGCARIVSKNKVD